MAKFKVSHGYIYRATITLKNGRVLRAKDYGKKAFAIPIGSLRKKS